MKSCGMLIDHGAAAKNVASNTWEICTLDAPDSRSADDNEHTGDTVILSSLSKIAEASKICHPYKTSWLLQTTLSSLALPVMPSNILGQPETR